MKIAADSPIYHAASAAMKGFPKTASSHGKGYSKAADVGNFSQIFYYRIQRFSEPVHVAISCFKKPKTLTTVLATFEFLKPYQPIGKIENTSCFKVKSVIFVKGKVYLLLK